MILLSKPGVLENLDERDPDKREYILYVPFINNSGSCNPIVMGSRPIVLWGCGKNPRGHEETFEGDGEKFILIVLIVSWVCAYV